MITAHTPSTRRARRWLAAGALTAATTIALAACGSSASSKSSAAAPPSTGGFAVSTASVAGVGTVLVDGSGNTLYVLSSEKGGKLTCTDANGCTAVWPDTELPSGVTQATAGSGVQASLLGTVKSSDGHLYVTYASYPLYRFSGDNAAGTAHGEGITSFGGTWYAVTPSGSFATAAASGGSSTTAGSSSSSSGGGYGY
ncbi:MAG TPA: hypothetical protein VGI06_02550 [Acidimicrobiales bacterium]